MSVRTRDVDGTFERWSMMSYSLEAIPARSVIYPSREALTR